jgi:hypothetical protein
MSRRRCLGAVVAAPMSRRRCLGAVVRAADVAAPSRR